MASKMCAQAKEGLRQPELGSTKCAKITQMWLAAIARAAIRVTSKERQGTAAQPLAKDLPGNNPNVGSRPAPEMARTLFSPVDTAAIGPDR